MDPHTESVAEAEAPAEEAGVDIESLPDAGTEDLSFEASLEAALDGLSGAAEEPVAQEPVAEEPVAQETA